MLINHVKRKAAASHNCELNLQPQTWALTWHTCNCSKWHQLVVIVMSYEGCTTQWASGWS